MNVSQLPNVLKNFSFHKSLSGIMLFMLLFLGMIFLLPLVNVILFVDCIFVFAFCTCAVYATGFWLLCQHINNKVLNYYFYYY